MTGLPWIDLVLLLGLLAALALAARLRGDADYQAVFEAHEGADDEPAPPRHRGFDLLATQAGLDPDRAALPFRGAQILLASFLVFFSFRLPSLQELPGSSQLAAGILGVATPEIWLRLRRRRRRLRIESALSFLLDLVVALLSAGLSLSAALRRAGAQGLPASHPLAREIWRVGLELDAGRDAAESLRGMAERTGSAAVRAVAAALGVALKHGTSVETALTTQADLSRAKLREGMRRKLNQAAVKALFPLFLCGFPVLLVLVLFPSTLELFEALRALRGAF